MLDDEAVAASRILVVDDDPGIRDMLGSALGYAGFDVHIAGDVPEAMRWLATTRADAIVLDVMLPGGSGFDVLQLIRSRDDRVPVLFLSARDAVDDRIRGLHLGGDDYVTKPFSVAEVSARLTALIRRARTVDTGDDAAEPPVLRCADLELDPLRHEVRRAGRPVALSPTEFRLLEYLLANQGHVMSRSQILEEIWMYDFGGTSQVVERFVSNLRRKIDDDHEPLIQTVRGVGYSLRRAAG